MLGQGHKIILTMSRWPNCPNMCGAKYVVPMRYKYVVPKCVVPGFPMWCPNMWCPWSPWSQLEPGLLVVLY